MRNDMRIILGFLAASFVAQSAAAENVAVILGEENLSRRDTASLEQAFTAQGMEMVIASDSTYEASRAALDKVAALALQGRLDRVLIFAALPAVQSGYDTWLIDEDANGVSALSIGEHGLSVSGLALLTSDAWEGGMLVIAPQPQRAPRLDEASTGLYQGLGTYLLPDRVTLASGESNALIDMIEQQLFRQDMSLAEIAETAPRSLSLAGYLPQTQNFMGPVQSDAPEALKANGFWDAVVALGTVEAYELYLKTYPEGPNAAEARRQITDIAEAPQKAAEAREEALALSRDDRRAIQRNLTLLGHDTRGIDGIIGPGSRAAIVAWQTANGLAPSSYLDAPQIKQLQEQAAIRAAELEAEAEARRIAQEQADRAFWAQTGEGQDEPGLRAYLSQYPNGLFSSLATERLSEIERVKREQAEAVEREAWDPAQSADTVEAYKAFLASYPDGAFSEAAKARIEELEREAALGPQIEADQAAEGRVAGSGLSRVLIEQRLAQFGLEPGPTDGTFDDATRNAIRRFQEAIGLPPTGYVGEATMVRLLAGR